MITLYNMLFLRSTILKLHNKEVNIQEKYAGLKIKLNPILYVVQYNWNLEHIYLR